MQEWLDNNDILLLIRLVFLRVDFSWSGDQFESPLFIFQKELI